MNKKIPNLMNKVFQFKRIKLKMQKMEKLEKKM